MNLLDLVPQFRRHTKQYIAGDDTDSMLAAYLADSVDALNWRWSRNYVVTNPAPNSYIVTPDIDPRDKRPIVVTASIIYKMGNLSVASFRDGDFAYDNAQAHNPLALDLAELDLLIPVRARLASAQSAPLRGYSNIFNRESYQFVYDYIFPV